MCIACVQNCLTVFIISVKLCLECQYKCVCDLLICALCSQLSGFASLPYSTSYLSNINHHSLWPAYISSPACSFSAIPPLIPLCSVMSSSAGKADEREDEQCSDMPLNLSLTQSSSSSVVSPSSHSANAKSLSAQQPLCKLVALFAN